MDAATPPPERRKTGATLMRHSSQQSNISTCVTKPPGSHGAPARPAEGGSFIYLTRDCKHLAAPLGVAIEN
jgi:hypothetical protein